MREGLIKKIVKGTVIAAGIVATLVSWKKIEEYSIKFQTKYEQHLNNPDSFAIYIVEPNENLWSIVKKYRREKCPIDIRDHIEKTMEYSNKSPLIRPGDTLVVPIYK